MFFYRAWAGNEEKFPQSAVYGPEIYVSQFYDHRWGYASLLILTLLVSLALNVFFLASFVANAAKQKMMPHLVFLFLSVRDLLVALILIPICIDWFIINIGFFEGDEIFCRCTAFLDYFLAAQYPILLIFLSIILYSRKYPKLEDRNFVFPLGEYDLAEAAPMTSQFMTETPSIRPQSQSAIKNPYRSSPPSSYLHKGSPQFKDSPIIKPPSVTGSSSGRRAPSAMSQNGHGRRAPSVAGSDTGYRPGSRGFQPQRPVMLNNGSGGPRRPGSVTGSIEGRLASGRRVTQLQQQQRFMTSSPLREVEEENSPDLWDAVSMDYPGNQSPDDWGALSDDDPHMYEEPRFHTWHYWIAILSWGLALGIGIPAAMFVEYQPLINIGSRNPRKGRPGCFMPADPFKNPYGNMVDDPGFNFTVSILAMTYILPCVLLVLMLLLICCKKLTDNHKFRRYVHILTMLTIVFIISRSPIDIVQLKGLVEAAMGFKQLNLLPYQLEYEILFVWATYLPLIANPIIYFCFCSEYREGGMRGLRSLCGCSKPSDDDENFKIDDKLRNVEILSSRSSVSKTQKSNIL